MIRWITDHLGTAAFEYATQNARGSFLLDVRDLVDKTGNLPTLAKSKMDEAVEQLRAGRKVIICCDYGISRSNAVAVGVLAVTEQIAFSDAVRRVRAATGEQAIKIEVLAAVRTAMEGVQDTEAPRNQPRPILVTGASGFIGQAFLKAWPNPQSIVAPPRNQLDLLAGAVDLDLCIKDNSVEVLVHLANPRIYTTNESMGQTVVMMKNVLDACRQNRLGLVYLSRGEIYAGYRSAGMLAAETLPPNPAGTFGQAKYLCEVLLEQHRRETGLACTVLRGSPVYGEGGDKPKFLGNFLHKALRGEPIVAHRYRNGFPSLDLLHVSDLVDALARVLRSSLDGDFNVGAGRGVSTTRVAELLVELTGSHSTIEHREIQEDAPNIVMDSTRARNLLGWEPRVDFSVGLHRLVKAHLANARTERSLP